MLKFQRSIVPFVFKASSLTALSVACLFATQPGFAGEPPDVLLQGYIKAFNTDADDAFGYTVAIDNDTLAIGAISEDGSASGGSDDNSLSGSGAAYVFTRGSSKGSQDWIPSAYLKGSNTAMGDQFGRQVAISGDLLAVSAIFEDSASADDPDDDSANASGAVYVFRRDEPGVWVEEAFLKASNAEEFDRFGGSIALSGDVLVVGAAFENSSATGVNQDESDNAAPAAGAAYVFRRDEGGNWFQQAYLKASNAEAGDQFGVSVSVSTTTVVIGAMGEDSSAGGVDGSEDNNDLPNSGAAYVFKQDGSGNWFQAAYLKAFNPQASSEFSAAVAVSDQTILIGAARDIRNGPGGSAYLYSENAGGQWLEQVQLKASNNDAFDGFGVSVALSGDRALVGANLEDGGNGNPLDDSAPNSGAGYLFERQPGGLWIETAYLKSSSPDSEDQFGRAVALSGSTYALGVPEEDSAARMIDGDDSNNEADRAGAAFVFIEINDRIFSSRFEG